MAKFDPYEDLCIKRNPDGTITRHFDMPKVFPNDDNPTENKRFVFKDISLNTDKKTWVRLFRPTKLPSSTNSKARLPIIIYYHGGMMILFSIAHAMFHELCGTSAAEVQAIFVSVEYRLAPEHRLPAAYDDAVDAILWVKEQALNQNGEQWLRDYGDFSRCYLMGNNSGANMALTAGLRALDYDLEPVKIVGLILDQPMFGGVQRTKSELMYAADQVLPLPMMDLAWELALPVGTDRDHRFCNPMIKGPHQDKFGSLGRCLVTGYGGDPLIDRQQELVKLLMKCGVQVVAHFDEFGFHGIDFVDQRRKQVKMGQIQDFINYIQDGAVSIN